MRELRQLTLASLFTLAVGLQACVKAEEKNDRKLKGSATSSSGSGSDQNDDDDDDDESASDVGSGKGKGSGSTSGSESGSSSGSGTGDGTAVASGSETGTGSENVPIITDDDDDDGTEAEVPADDALTYFNYAKAVLDAKCATCHTDPPTGNAGAAFRLDQWDDAGAVLGVASKLTLIKARIRQNNMPPAGSPALTEEEHTKLQAWINGTGGEGAPVIPEPTVSVKKPAKVGVAPDAATGKVLLEAVFTDTVADAKWAAFSTATRGATTGGTAIVEDRPVATPTYEWDTSAVTEGEYFVYFVVTQGEKTAKAASAGSVLVNRPTSPGVNPTVAFDDAWNGLSSSDRAHQFPTTVGYTATDADTIKLQFKTESQTAWTDVPDADMNYGSKTWTPATPPTEGVEYRMRVIGTNADGGKAIAESEKVIGLTTFNYTFEGSGDELIKTLLGARCAPCHDDGGTDDNFFVHELWGPANSKTLGGGGPFREKVLTRVITSPNPMPPVGDTGGRLTADAPERAELRVKMRLWDWQGRRQGTP